MKTFDTAKSLRDLIDYYCMRCNVGLCECKIAAVDCPKISGDRDFESVTASASLKSDAQER